MLSVLNLKKKKHNYGDFLNRKVDYENIMFFFENDTIQFYFQLHVLLEKIMEALNILFVYFVHCKNINKHIAI